MSSGGGGARKKKGGHEEHEEHVNHERWLVSYADMLTLLFVLFVVLFSMSSVDQKKFAELAAGLSEGFGASSVAMTGNVSNLEGAGQSTQVVPIDPGTNPGDGGTGTEGMTKEQKEAVDRALRAASRKEASANAQAATKEAENLKEVEKKIADALQAAKLLNQVKFTIDQRGLVVTVVTNEVVFAGNRADLKPGGKKILDAIAPALKKLPNNIEVDGNTNQLKATTSFYPSGWELSAARASTTVRYLIDHGLAKGRMSAVGFSDTKPLIDPKDKRAVTMNRRVDVVVLTQLKADEAALLPAAAGDDAKLHTGTTTAQAEAEAKAGTGTTESNTESPTTTHD
ncbi:flagellar motor protein MotB [Actinoplanes friuliensis]|jgi:chemotaxis protein MotB|uniref:Putative flagellar motor protein n=1 Tax=Actinoplanes friuliensis DSM 7358 TaxID=1246995 RepID=U5WBI2_9ACTN|nr:flagellar motor protein MotB [Actinoplanes friuliensis]AGZ46352.1 putative flagellar motor protein [Actinoplanes friuliensis DSM 7358]